MQSAGIEALMVSEPHNVFYLCGSNGGYTGARVRLIVDGSSSILIIDKRYLEEAEQGASADTIVAWTSSSYSEVAQVISGLGAKKVGYEAAHITVRQLERLSKELEAFELVGVSNLTEPGREVKEDYEVQKISEAAAIADAAFLYIIDFIKPGVTELDIAVELDYFMRKKGAERPSFDTIVASGAHSAIPHATPSRKKIETGDFVKLDFGAVVDGYHSDMTRTVVLGTPGAKQREIYDKVLEAQEAALAAVAAGQVCQDLDNISRAIIADAGYGENFVHGLGHGVGLQVHERPTLAKGVEDLLKANNVVTVEPGIYINGFGGVRIEDLVLVTETGCSILSHSTKALLEL